MDRAEILEFFSLRDKAWQDHDAGTLAAGHTENGEVESPLFGKIKGNKAILQAYIEWFSIFPDTEYHVEHQLIDGNKAAELITMTGTQQKECCGLAPTGKRVQFHGTSLYILKEGKIDREVRIYDFTGLMLQLGVLKAKPMV